MITAQKFLNSLIKELNYSSFCEIGYHNGETTEAINLSNDQKVSVDPSPDISTKYINGMSGGDPRRPGYSLRYCKHDLRLMTSDKFFETNERQFDLFLIDGDHSYEQVYRDIQNSLKFLTPRGVIFCHDAAPFNIELTTKNRCGDAYKAILRLRTEKNNLTVYALNEYITDYGPSDPSGYALIFRQYQEPWKEKLNLDDKNFNAYEYMINNYRELLTFIKFQKALQIIKERNKKL